MAEPPRDPDGVVRPHDDPDLQDDTYLFRRVPKQFIKPDEIRGGIRVSSQAFVESSASQSRYGGMSVDIAHLVAEPAALVPAGGALVQIVARNVRAKGYQVGSEPLPENEAHANVWHRPNGRPNKKIKIDHEEYEWVIRPAPAGA